MPKTIYENICLGMLYTNIQKILGTRVKKLLYVLLKALPPVCMKYVTRPAKIDHVSAKKLPIFSVFAVS